MRIKWKGLLFINEIGDPEHPFPLLNLDRAEIEAGSTLVQANAVGQPNSGGHQEERRLRIGSALQEQRLGGHQLAERASAEIPIEPTMPSNACTLSRSVFRIVSSVTSPKAFFK